MILNNPHEDVVREIVFRGAPFAFDLWPDGWDLLRNHVSKTLSVPADDITTPTAVPT
jgi:hypothetical protein